MDYAAIPTSEVWYLVAEFTGKAGAEELLESLKAYRRGEDHKKQVTQALARERAADARRTAEDAKKRAQAELAAVRLREMLQDAEPEVREHFPAKGVDRAIMDAVTDGVLLADGCGKSSAYSLLLLMPFHGVPHKVI